METKHCWNSHDTVYLGLKKKKEIYLMPKKVQVLTKIKKKTMDKKMIMLMVEMPVVINIEGITYRN